MREVEKGRERARTVKALQELRRSVTRRVRFHFHLTADDTSSAHRIEAPSSSLSSLALSSTRSLLRIKIEIHLAKTLKVCHNSKLRLLLLMSRAYCVTHLIKRAKHRHRQRQHKDCKEQPPPFALPPLANAH